MLPGLPGGIDYGSNFDDDRPEAAWGLSGKESGRKDVVLLVRFGEGLYHPEEARSYGRALKAGERGIILAPLLKEGGRYVVPRPVHPVELRSSILFWDQVDVPFNNLAQSTLCPDLEFLRNEGLLRQTYLKFSGMYVPGMVVSETAIAALRNAERTEPSQWSLGRDANSPQLSRGILEERSGLLLKLFDALPVPAKRVPLADILEFKAKRLDEVRALQHHLEGIYQHILSAPDRPRAEDRELNALDLAIRNYVKTIREAPFKKVLSRLDASLDLPQAVVAASGAVAAFVQGLPLTQAVIGAGAALSVSLGLGRKDKSGSQSPFEYVGHYHKELF